MAEAPVAQVFLRRLCLPAQALAESVRTANCSENNNHVEIAGEGYFLSADGLLMPTRKDQPPPDLRYFKPPPR